MYVVKPGVAFNNDVEANPVNSWEVIYSSLLAVAERVGEVFGKVGRAPWGERLT